VTKDSKVYFGLRRAGLPPRSALSDPRSMPREGRLVLDDDLDGLADQSAGDLGQLPAVVVAGPVAGEGRRREDDELRGLPVGRPRRRRAERARAQRLEEAAERKEAHPLRHLLEDGGEEARGVDGAVVRPGGRRDARRALRGRTFAPGGAGRIVGSALPQDHPYLDRFANTDARGPGLVSNEDQGRPPVGDGQKDGARRAGLAWRRALDGERRTSRRIFPRSRTIWSKFSRPRRVADIAGDLRAVCRFSNSRARPRAGDPP
jgi:hypothetical protein